MHINSAINFIQIHGDPIAHARVATLLTGQSPAEVPPALVATQNPDGGFAFGGVPGRPSALNDTAQALQALADLRLLDRAAATAALAFIAGRQNRRGIWREGPELAPFDPPLWMVTDSPAADVYTTALCASALAQWGDDLLLVDRAVNWLQSQQGRDGLLQGFRLHSSWLALPAFVEVLEREARVTRRLVGSLGEALRSDWTGAMLASALRSFVAAGYTDRTAVVVRLWELLQTTQQPDGSVMVDESEDAVAATVDALAVALHFGGET